MARYRRFGFLIIIIFMSLSLTIILLTGLYVTFVFVRIYSFLSDYRTIICYQQNNIGSLYILFFIISHFCGITLNGFLSNCRTSLICPFMHILWILYIKAKSNIVIYILLCCPIIGLNIINIVKNYAKSGRSPFWVQKQGALFPPVTV